MQGEPSQKEKLIAFLLGISVGLVVLAIALYQIPQVQDRLNWRMDFAMAFLRGIVDPVRPMPTPVGSTVVAGLGQEGTDVPPIGPTHTATLAPATATIEPTVQDTPVPTNTPAPTLTPTQIPAKVDLPAPAYEKQEVNNCGPATLAMDLRFYNWTGNQSTISDLIKPKREDRNVNVEELVTYVNTQVPGVEVQYRVGGDIDTLRRLIAAGFPVMVEEAFIMAESYWYQDDRWAGHYLLLTGYDDATQRFTAQDVFVGPNVGIAYNILDKHWKALTGCISLCTLRNSGRRYRRFWGISGTSMPTGSTPWKWRKKRLRPTLQIRMPGSIWAQIWYILRSMELRPRPTIRHVPMAYRSACCATSLARFLLISIRLAWKTSSP